MGSSESTRRSNGTEEEEESQPENDGSGGSSRGAGKAIAIAAAGTAVAVWGISRMLSASTDKENQEEDEVMTIKAPGMESYFPNSHSQGHQEYEAKRGSNSTPSTCSLPPSRRYKMNTDGGCRASQGPSGYQREGPSGYGGILRDDRGKWVRGFYGFIGVSDCLTAEFHGIHKGLELLDNLGLRESILESDSEQAVKWIKEQNDGPGKSPIIRACWRIIEDSKHLVRKNRITIKHIHGKNANKCADKLANMAIDSQVEYLDLKDPPDEIKDIVDAESSVFKL